MSGRGRPAGLRPPAGARLITSLTGVFERLDELVVELPLTEPLHRRCNGALVSRRVVAQPSGELGVELVPTLEALLVQADVVTIHLPKTPDTEGLLGEREIALMKPGARLVNTSRGGLVDEAALAKVRASYGVNIGRPGWDQMLGGVSLSPNARSNCRSTYATPTMPNGRWAPCAKNSGGSMRW